MTLLKHNNRSFNFGPVEILDGIAALSIWIGPVLITFISWREISVNWKPD